MDFITQLPVTKSGHDAIVVFVDRLTKMVHFAPTFTECSAKDVARLFNDTVFKHHGLPLGLNSDRDPRFTSKFWTELTRLLGTKLKMSTVFHPQTMMVRRRGQTAFLKITSDIMSAPLKMIGTSGCLRRSSR
jgi:hypothetical protein